MQALPAAPVSNGTKVVLGVRACFQSSFRPGASEPALLDTLASLVHAAAEGVVRDVALATPEANDFLRRVADSAGCELVEGPDDRGALVSQVAGRMKSPWIFVIEQGFAPGGDWMNDVANFVAREDASLPRSPGGAC